MTDQSELLIMAKPTGALCNMRCRYCYYQDKRALPGGAIPRMSDALLARYISQRLCGSPGPVTHFEWHGGEPTLLGVEFFRNVVHLERQYLQPGQTVSNGLQTNGLLLDDDWAAFLAAEGFSVGLSLDGPSDLHDAFRKTADGDPTHSRVVEAFQLLKKHGVFCTLLCVIHAANVREPNRVYDYFCDLGARYIQFLPLVTQAGEKRVSACAAQPDAIGSFLCRIFDRWIARDVGRIVIQNIDEALRSIYGVEHALCVHRKTCGTVAVLERDGDFYPCDHFVRPEHYIGNLHERSLADLASDPQMRHFGEAKQLGLPDRCLACSVLDACNGGCPKDRLIALADSKHRLNFLCPAYKAFFNHTRPALIRLAAHMKAGRPLRAF